MLQLVPGGQQAERRMNNARRCLFPNALNCSAKSSISLPMFDMFQSVIIVNLCQLVADPHPLCQTLVCATPYPPDECHTGSWFPLLSNSGTMPMPGGSNDSQTSAAARKVASLRVINFWSSGPVKWSLMHRPRANAVARQRVAKEAWQGQPGSAILTNNLSTVTE